MALRLGGAGELGASEAKRQSSQRYGRECRRHRQQGGEGGQGMRTETSPLTVTKEGQRLL